MSVSQGIKDYLIKLLGEYGCVSLKTHNNDYTKYVIEMWSRNIGISHQISSFTACSIWVKHGAESSVVINNENPSIIDLTLNDPKMLDKLRILVCGQIIAAIFLRIHSGNIGELVKIKISLDHFLKQVM